MLPIMSGPEMMFIQLLGVLQTMKTNQEDAQNVAERTQRMMKALTESLADKTMEDVDPELARIVSIFDSDLKTVYERVCQVASEEKKYVSRILRHKQHQKIIEDCKNLLDHAFQEFQIRSQRLMLKGVHRPAENRIANDTEAKVLGNLEVVFAPMALTSAHYLFRKEIPRHQVDILDQLGKSANVLRARLTNTTEGCAVVVKTYGDGGGSSWLKDGRFWLENWRPNSLQVIGRSREHEEPMYLVLRDPGTNIQLVVQEECEKCPGSAAHIILNLMIQLTEAARRLGGNESGYCKLDTAEVYVRPGPTSSIVLADFEPNRFFPGDVKEDDQFWTAFLSLAAKSLTGSPVKANYTLDQDGRTGRKATLTCKYLLHFLYDLRYTVVVDPSVMNVLEELIDILTGIQREFNNTEPTGSNPLLPLLQNRYPSSLCGVWDVWESLSVTPGDVGVFRGTDGRTPVFQTFCNVASHIADVKNVQFDTLHLPKEPTVWKSHPTDAGLIRHTVQVTDPKLHTNGFAVTLSFYRDYHLSFLGPTWNFSMAWSYLLGHRQDMEKLAQQNGVQVEDICLIWSTSKSKQTTELSITDVNTLEELQTSLESYGFQDGLMYYFETPTTEEGHVLGYWSASAEPGHPIWPPSPTSAGPDYCWELHKDHFKVEVKRNGPVQHVRYLSL